MDIVMDGTNIAIDDKNECDSITALELQKTKRMLYFSDGAMEELSDSSDGEDIGPDATDKSMDVNIDVTTLPFIPRVKYQAYQMGSHVLSGIDYVGEGLARFLGITTPKYMSESDIENASNNQTESHELDDNGTWQQNNNNNANTIITRYPPNTANNSP